ncbi:MAG: cell division protein FtsZ [Pseudomonadota bacterium]
MVAPSPHLRPKITIIGVGGAGGNAIDNMIRARLEGVDFVAANTDAQALESGLAERKVQLGEETTSGLGAGAKPEVGRASAEESLPEIQDILEGTHMVFITAGLGGGTGTGAAPIIARAAKEKNILTVGVITKPFDFEGAARMRAAEEGLAELRACVDTLIIIPNQNLFRVASEHTTFAEAFSLADEVLHAGVRGITDLMVKKGLINLDFADIRTVMAEMGSAMMGTGEATGENRAIEAAEAAISNPLLDDTTMRGARGVLIHVTGGMDVTLFEVDEATNRIRDEVDPQANIIFGSTLDETLEGTLRVSVVATGIDREDTLVRGEDMSTPSQSATSPEMPVKSSPATSFASADPLTPPASPQPAKTSDTARPAATFTSATPPSVTSRPSAAPATPSSAASTPSLTPPAQQANPPAAPPAPAVMSGQGHHHDHRPAPESGGLLAQVTNILRPERPKPVIPDPPSRNVFQTNQLDLSIRQVPLEPVQEDQVEIPAFLRRPVN